MEMRLGKMSHKEGRDIGRKWIWGDDRDTLRIWG